MNRGSHLALVFAWILLTISIIAWPRLTFALDGDAGAFQLITEVPADGDNSQPDHSFAVVRQRLVRANAAALIDGAVPQVLALQLFPNIQYVANLLWIESGPDGGLAWIGRLADQPNSRITLVVCGDLVSATIWVQGRRYDLRPLGNGLHLVQEIGSDALLTSESRFDKTIRTMATVENSNVVRSDLMDDEERQVLALVNVERSKVNGLSPLAANDQLTLAAQAHSQDMSNQDYFSHTSLDGRTPADRIAEAGYDASAWGENIAYGYTTPEAVMNGWMNSSGHRANILGDSFCDLGVGHTAAGHYWTQDFGRKKGVTACSDGANQHPNAVFTAQPTSGLAPLLVNLDAGASNDPDGDDLSCSWDLGDGQSATTIKIVHTFAVAGLYTIRLTVDDGHGGSDTIQQQITVQSENNTAPQARDDTYVCDQNHSLSVSAPGVLGNDDDEQNSAALNAILETAPTQGTLLLSANGAFDYQPPPNFLGEERFTYKATDGQFQSETAAVTINVQDTSSPASTSDNSTSGGGGCFVDTLSGPYPIRPNRFN